MKYIPLTALGGALIGCSQSGDEMEAKLADLPPRFHLNCSAPERLGNRLPDATGNGFTILVDLRAKEFSAPWRNGREAIKAIRPGEIVFLDEHVERGLDNNPMETQMRFDVRTRQLEYRNIYSARMHVNESFRTSCEVVVD